MANEEHLAKRNEIVVFVGYADDADDAVRAVLDTEAELQKRLRRYCEAANIDPLVFRYWEWKRDAESLPGGQESTVTPVVGAPPKAFSLHNLHPHRIRASRVPGSDVKTSFRFLRRNAKAGRRQRHRPSRSNGYPS